MRLSLRKVSQVTIILALIGCFNLFWNHEVFSSLFSVATEGESKHGRQDGPVDMLAARSYILPEYDSSGKQQIRKKFYDTKNLRYHRSAKSLNAETKKHTKNFHKSEQKGIFRRETELNDIFISVKSTLENHKTRVRLLLDTWIDLAKNQTYLFTDAEDEAMASELQSQHFINTKCSNRHNRKALCCKMSQEFDYFIYTRKRWFCHVDDDTYVNVDQLLNLLRQYNHTEDWYLGKPSLSHPLEAQENTQQKIAFWFATGGAGFCISQSLALKMIPYAGGGRLMTTCEQIRLPDDCTVGYIIGHLLHKDLTVIETFHSHLEPLWKIKLHNLQQQITFSYVKYKDRENKLDVPGLPETEDPTRFLSIHCHLNPSLEKCLDIR